MSSEHSKKKENNPIHNIIKKNKILRNKFNKRRARLYIENYKMLLREIREDLTKQRGISHLWIGRLSSVKMAVIPILIYNFYKNFNLFFTFIESGRLFLKFVWKSKS